MDFQTLLEGTMVGAEISALTEAVSIDVSAAKSADTYAEFKAAIREPFAKFYDQLGRYTQEIKKVTVKNRKKIKANIEAFAQAEKSAEKISEGLKRLGYPSIKASDLADALEVVWKAAKDLREEALKTKTALEKRIEELKDKAKSTAKDTKVESSKVQLEGVVVKESTKLGERLLQEGSKEVKALEKIVENLNKKVSDFEDVIKLVNKEIVNASRVTGVDLVKYPSLDEYVDGNVMEAVKTNPKEVGKVAHVIETLKAKMKAIIERVAKEINDPSIGTVAATIAVAVASYLVLYGAVKSSGGKVGNPAAVGTTLKAAVEVVKTGTPGKKVLVLFLSVVFVSLVGVAGKTGYNYIRKLLENRK